MEIIGSGSKVCQQRQKRPISVGKVPVMEFCWISIPVRWFCQLPILADMGPTAKFGKLFSHKKFVQVTEIPKIFRNPPRRSSFSYRDSETKKLIALHHTSDCNWLNLFRNFEEWQRSLQLIAVPQINLLCVTLIVHLNYIARLSTRVAFVIGPQCPHYGWK